MKTVPVADRFADQAAVHGFCAGGGESGFFPVIFIDADFADYADFRHFVGYHGCSCKGRDLSVSIYI
jgi:hypothetical protein